MEVVVVILIIAAIVGGVMWNKSNAAAAAAGVTFVIPADPQRVASAIHAAYNVGAGAKLKSLVGGVRVTGGGSRFDVQSKMGDVGRIDVSATANGSSIRASTQELYIGSYPPPTNVRSGLFGFSRLIIHRCYVLLGISPGAAAMKRFQSGLEGRVAKQLRSAG